MTTTAVFRGCEDLVPSDDGGGVVKASRPSVRFLPQKTQMDLGCQGKKEKKKKEAERKNERKKNDDVGIYSDVHLTLS